MSMTLSDFIDEVRENIKRDSNGVSDARVTRWVNWGKDYIADLHTYEEMRDVYDGATVAEQARYGFPTRMKDIYSVTLQDGSSSRTLKYVPARLFDQMVPRALTNGYGASEWYVDYGVNFELYRVPDAVYSLVLRCSVYPEDLSADSDTCDLLRKDALIVAVATTFGFYSLREVDDAAYWGSQIVPSLYQSSLTSDHSAEDWVPVARGFGDSISSANSLVGNWWTNPFVGHSFR